MEPTTQSFPDEVAVTSWDQVEALRARQAAGEPIPLEQWRGLYRFLRQSRMTAAIAAPKGKSKSAADLGAAKAAFDDLLKA